MWTLHAVSVLQTNQHERLLISKWLSKKLRYKQTNGQNDLNKTKISAVAEHYLRQELLWSVVFVSWLVSMLTWRRNWFHDGCSASAPNVAIIFWYCQGQICRTANLTLAVARPWFKIFSPNLTIREKSFGHEICLSIKFKMATWLRFALSECFF